MGQGRKRALLNLVFWGVAAVGFTATVMYSGGPATYADDEARRIIGGIFLAVGVFGTPIVLYVTRKRRVGKHVVSDERDEKISKKATSAGLIVVHLYVFLLCIALWDHYQSVGCVPVGWMWFLAYSVMILSYVIPSVAALIIDSGVAGSVEG